MNRQLLLWLAIPLAAFTLSACDGVDDDTDDTDDDVVVDADVDTTISESVATGAPDSDSFSLSISEASVADAYGVDGVTTTMSVQVADHDNNPVADGTTVAFWTEFGRIEDICETSGGSCSVTWTSGGHRPDDGLSTIVAYVVGEDTFLESNPRDGIYDIGEIIISQPEPFYDRNVDSSVIDETSYTDLGTSAVIAGGDTFLDYNENGDYDTASSLYRGPLCSEAAEAAGHCAETSVYVWDSSQIALSTPSMQAVVDAGPWVQGNTYTIAVSDSFGNFPPVGTTVTITGVGDADAVVDISGTVPSVGGSSIGTYNFSAFVDTADTVATGSHRITVTSPSGLVTFYYVDVD